MIHAKFRSNEGFSLIELALVVVIGGLLFAMFANALLVSQQQAKTKVTRERLEAIDLSIRNFYIASSRYPCAAPRNVASDAANYALEVANCSSTAPGTLRAAPFGGGAHRVRIGTVPTRTLGLPDIYGYDAWGSRILYAVNEADTNTTTFATIANAIDVVDGVGNSVIAPQGSLSYILVSHGQNREGAFNNSGSRTACSGNHPNGDGENCDDDSTFRNTIWLSSSDGPDYFDDFLSYKASLVKPSEVPPGAVMAFDLAACPTGWTLYSDLNGRVIVGGGVYNQPGAPPDTGAASYSGETYNYGDFGGFATTKIPAGTAAAPASEFKTTPPYKVLTYCIKV